METEGLGCRSNSSTLDITGHRKCHEHLDLSIQGHSSGIKPKEEEWP